MTTDSFDQFGKTPEELAREAHGFGPNVENNNTAARSNGTIVNLIHGRDLTPAQYEWEWLEYLPKGKLVIGAGAVGTGKTTIAICMAATITSGGRWPDGTYAEMADVLVWSGEDSAADTLLPRFIVAGGDRDKIHFVANVIAGGKKRAFNPSIDMPALTEAAQSLPGLGMIIVDPVVMMVAGDSHKNAEVRRGLQPLVGFAEERNAVALGITHLTKGTAGRDPIERLTGSLAFGASPRVVWMAARPVEPDQPRRLVRVKSNIGPDGDGFEYSLEQVLLEGAQGVYGQRLIWGNPLYGAARELLKDIEELKPGRPPKERTAAMTLLLTTLENGPMPSQWIKNAAKEAGLTWATVRRAAEDLNIVMTRIGGLGSEGHWQWELPNDLNPGDETDL